MEFHFVSIFSLSKKLKTMKNMLYLLLVLMIFPLTSNANNGYHALSDSEMKTLDISGKWIGKRYQYTYDRKAYVQVFEYEFDLIQDGDKVSGTTTLIAANGDYADMKVKGVVVGNTLHFEEYEVVSQKIDPDRVWCFKAGELKFEKENGFVHLTGSTNSYMTNYYLPCSGGYTDIAKSADVQVSEATINAGSKLNFDININVFPNPTFQSASIVYTLTSDEQVNVEVSTLDGKVIAVLENSKQKAGTHNLHFDAAANGLASGVYIIKLKAGEKVFSRQLVKMD
jgi:hypothetical protein